MTTGGGWPEGARRPSGVEGWGNDGKGGSRQPLDVDLQKVFEELDWLQDHMQDAANSLAEADRAWTRSKVAYELAYAEQVLKATAKNKEGRDAQALIACHTLYEDVMLNEQVLRTCKEATFTLKNRLGAFQSMSAILRGATN